MTDIIYINDPDRGSWGYKPISIEAKERFENAFILSDDGYYWFPKDINPEIVGNSEFGKDLTLEPKLDS